MKTFLISAVLVCAVFICGCNRADKTQNTTVGGKNENSAAPPVSTDAAATDAPNSTANKTAAANLPKGQAKEPLPQKVDRETAYSPVYAITSKNCINRDGTGGEGEDFTRKCTAYGDYNLWAYGFEGLTNYRIESKNAKDQFVTYLFPLETGDAQDYVRADLYAQKLGDKIEWRLDEKGKPYAIIVRASFYKNTGAKVFDNPKNKVAEFLLVRGLAGYEDLKEDVPTKNTAYNPNEWARKIAYEFLEKNRE